MLKTVTSAWIRWKELRKAALVATVQINQADVEEEKGDEEWEVMIAKTHFVQEWAREANKDKQKQNGNPTLPPEYK